MKVSIKRMCTYTSILIMICSIGVVSAYSGFNKIKTKLCFEGKVISTDQDIINIDGSTYVPLRELFEKIGYTVDWNGTEDAININKFYDKKLSVNLDTVNTGIIESNQRYEFAPKSTYNISLDYLDTDIIYSETRNRDLIPDARTAVEIARNYFYAMYTGDRADSSISYGVTYDTDHNAWYVFQKFEHTMNTSPKGILIRSCDGCILGIHNM